MNGIEISIVWCFQLKNNKIYEYICGNVYRGNIIIKKIDALILNYCIIFITGIFADPTKS
jgi:hypothetical protein